MSEIVGGLRRLEARRSIRSHVVETIRRSIVVGDLTPGLLYSVAQIADELGVSRTPVREALRELASRGMVAFERKRGVRVVPISPSQIRDMFELRLLLEVPATRHAVENMTEIGVAEMSDILTREETAGNDKLLRQQLDRAFRDRLLFPAGNSLLVETVDRLRDMVLVRQSEAPQDSGYDFEADHRAVLDSVRERDIETRLALVTRHLHAAADVMGADSSLIYQR